MLQTEMKHFSVSPPAPAVGRNDRSPSHALDTFSANRVGSQRTLLVFWSSGLSLYKARGARNAKYHTRLGS